MKNEALWQRLEAYDFDERLPGSLSFSKRLALENGWPKTFAQRAIEEYKRFVYLGHTAGHPVTPSDEVDQVWHLHLLYTQEYWDYFCPIVLQHNFYHGPTKGGSSENKKYTDWYETTKNSYSQAFGIEPPADIWPPSEIRFRNNFLRVNLDQHWVFEKSTLTKYLIAAFIFALIGFIIRLFVT